MRHLAAALLAALAAGVLLGAPSDARAQRAKLGVSVPTHYSASPSFQAVDADGRYASFAADATLTLDEWLPLRGLRGVVTATSSGSSATAFGRRYQFDWSRGLYLVGADWGYRFGDIFRPYVRLTGGAAVQNLRMSAPGLPAPVAQKAAAFATKNSLGAELHVPYDRPDADTSFAFSEHAVIGLSAQVGFLAQTDASFDGLRAGETDGSDDPPSWSESGYDLGSLQVGSWFWDVGLFAEYRF